MESWIRAPITLENQIKSKLFDVINRLLIPRLLHYKFGIELSNITDIIYMIKLFRIVHYYNHFMIVDPSLNGSWSKPGKITILPFDYILVLRYHWVH